MSRLLSMLALAGLVFASVPVHAELPPLMPTNFEGRISAGANGLHDVILTWTPSIGAAANETYRVYRDGIPIATTSALSAVDAVPNTIHVYQVAAINSAGEGPLTAPLVIFDPCKPSTSRVCGLMVFRPCDMVFSSPTRTICNIDENINSIHLVGDTLNLPPAIGGIIGCGMYTLSIGDYYPFVGLHIHWECIPVP